MGNSFLFHFCRDLNIFGKFSEQFQIYLFHLISPTLREIPTRASFVIQRSIKYHKTQVIWILQNGGKNDIEERSGKTECNVVSFGGYQDDNDLASLSLAGGAGDAPSPPCGHTYWLLCQYGILYAMLYVYYMHSDGLMMAQGPRDLLKPIPVRYSVNPDLLGGCGGCRRCPPPVHHHTKLLVAQLVVLERY